MHILTSKRLLSTARSRVRLLSTVFIYTQPGVYSRCSGSGIPRKHPCLADKPAANASSRRRQLAAKHDAKVLQSTTFSCVCVQTLARHIACCFVCDDVCMCLLHFCHDCHAPERAWQIHSHKQKPAAFVATLLHIFRYGLRSRHAAAEATA